MAEFDPKASRAKRPLPLWVDAFLRDTQSLETDEVGAYLKILMAMWVRPDLTLPNEPKKLARAAGVSLRLWKSRIGPAIAEFFDHAPEGVTQKRLQKEAAYVERHVKQQSDRKRNKNSSNSLKTKDLGSTADVTSDKSADEPTQQPNNPTITLVANATNAAGSGELAEKGGLSQEKETNLNTAIWAEGVDLLSSYDVPEKQARSCIGKWLKGSERLSVLQAIRAAASSGTQEPISYITAILKKPKENPVSSLVTKALGGDGRAR